jgi:hypothetical protein
VIEEIDHKQKDAEKSAKVRIATQFRPPPELGLTACRTDKLSSLQKTAAVTENCDNEQSY